MADDAALRNRRLRAHKAGDHSLCGPRCTVRRVTRAAKLGPVPESVFDAVALFASSVQDWAADDPRRVRVAIAFRLAQQADEGDVAASKELLRVVNDLVVFDLDRDPDALDALRSLDRDQALAWMERHSPGDARRIKDAETRRKAV